MVVETKVIVQDGMLDMVEFDEMLQSSASFGGQRFNVVDLNRFDIDG